MPIVAIDQFLRRCYGIWRFWRNYYQDTKMLHSHYDKPIFGNWFHRMSENKFGQALATIVSLSHQGYCFAAMAHYLQTQRFYCHIPRHFALYFQWSGKRNQLHTDFQSGTNKMSLASKQSILSALAHDIYTNYQKISHRRSSCLVKNQIRQLRNRFARLIPAR